MIKSHQQLVANHRNFILYVKEMTGMLLKLDSSMIKNASPEDFIVNFSNLLIDQPYEIALINVNLWYSWYNIADFYNNNDMRVSNETRWINITIPNGIMVLNNSMILLEEDLRQ